MARLDNGRIVSPKAQARRALRNAQTRATRHAERGDLERAALALLAGTNTALAWLDGTHHRLAH